MGRGTVSVGVCGWFFFSRRRRHTRCSRDWSSDVCSSDLNGRAELSFTGAAEEGQQFFVSTEKTCRDPPAAIDYAREWPGRPEEGFSRLLWCAHQSRQAPAFLPKDRPALASRVAPTRFFVASSRASASSKLSNSGTP